MKKPSPYFQKSARSARLFALAFGSFFLAMTIGCLLDRSKILENVLGQGFMERWLHIQFDNDSLVQLAIMTAGGFGMFAFMIIVHQLVGRDKNSQP